MYKYQWTKQRQHLFYYMFFNDKKNCLKHGNTCIWFPIDGIAGIKLFFSEDTRDFSHKAQELAYKHSIGPCVGDKFVLEFPHIKQDGSWHGEGWLENISLTKLHGYVSEKAEEVKHGQVSEKRYRELEEQLHQIGFGTEDISPSNVGLIRENLVLIDFDPESIGASHGFQNDIG